MPTPLDSALLVPKGVPPQTPVAMEPVPLADAAQTPATDQEAPPVRRSALAPKPKPVRVPLTVKIRPETLRRLRLVAVHHEVEQQEIVEEALTQWLDANEPRP